MQINLYEDKDIKELKFGDVIVFANDNSNDNSNDYYLLIQNHTDTKGKRYQLLSLFGNEIVLKYKDKRELIENIQMSMNGYHLKEIISSDELELRRID